MVLKLIKYQWPDIDKTYFFVKDPLESKYQFEKVRFQQKRIYEKVGIKGIKVGIKHEWKSKTFIDYFQKIYGLYQNVEYNWTKKMEDIEDLKDREDMGDKRYES